VLSGLVLAGANRPPPQDLDALLRDDGGILTAEAVASLPLDGLELAVLSACDSSLGETAGGEGVFGLQRAFHLAGTRDVVGSLWKVDDKATAALMALFYYNSWRNGLEPLAALHAAQLTLYHHPERIPALARERGLKLDEVLTLPTTPARGNGRAPVKQWAAFVLSGPGRPACDP
jgi:CHAT domain-containing protein